MTIELLRKKVKWGIAHKNGSFWFNISSGVDLTMDFVREHADYINWYALSKNEYFKCDIDFLNEFKDKINWKNFTRYSPSMDEEVARHFIDFIDWHSFPYENFKSIEFYREFKDKIDWIRFSYNFPLKKLSSTFINEFNNEEWWSHFKFRSHQLPIDIQMRYREQLVRNND